MTRKDEAGVSHDARQGALKREGSLGTWERLPGGGADSWPEKSGRISSLYSANQLPLHGFPRRPGKSIQTAPCSCVWMP